MKPSRFKQKSDPRFQQTRERAQTRAPEPRPSEPQPPEPLPGQLPRLPRLSSRRAAAVLILLPLLFATGFLLYGRSAQSRRDADWVNGPSGISPAEPSPRIVDILDSDQVLWITSDLAGDEAFLPAAALGAMITKYIPGSQGRYRPAPLPEDTGEALFMLTRFRQEAAGFDSALLAGQPKLAAWLGDLTGQEPSDPEAPGLEESALVSPLYSAVFQCVVRKNDGPRALRDLKGKRVSLGPANLETTLLSALILSLQGLTPEDYQPVCLDLAASVKALESGEIDCVALCSALPNQEIASLAANTELTLLPVEGADFIDHLESYLPGCRITRIDAGAYKGLDEMILSVSTDILLTTSRQASRDLIFRVTEAIYGNISELKKIFPMDQVYKTSSFNNSAIADLHQGALDYYREQGLIWR